MSRFPQASRFLTTMAFLSLTGCGLGGPAHGPAMANAAAVVDMGFSSFNPASATIRVGQIVEWRNTSVITHSVTDDHAIAKDPNDASIPAGATAFNSGDIPAGHVFVQTFTVPGTYKYFCTHHEGDGMEGTIVVQPAPAS
jgi:plastocyanin